MNLKKEDIKYFPAYEEVFATDIDKCREHFLPICSINLKCVDPTNDQWLHFISAKEIYDGCVGQETEQWHTEYCKMDMLGFDIIGDKYAFEADWNYFAIEKMKQSEVSNLEIVQLYRNKRKEFQNVEELKTWLFIYKDDIRESVISTIIQKHMFYTNPSSDQGLVESLLDRLEKQAIEADQDSLIGAYQINEDTFQLAKSFYKKHKHIYPSTIGNYSSKIYTLEQLENNYAKDREYMENPEIGGIIDDIQFLSKGEQEYLTKYNVSLEEAKAFEGTNLIEKPFDKDGNIFDYIGRLTGYIFQGYGADSVYLFYNKELKKAVICFEYT
ncbi:hypothetical protein [Myroides phaeus]|uniref:hypothetical protein n=1 Tax=Myroides phaeus TaxID=702745 RepID=UPI00130363E6|nr:hypothetical protein [Myroides phaeus]